MTSVLVRWRVLLAPLWARPPSGTRVSSPSAQGNPNRNTSRYSTELAVPRGTYSQQQQIATVDAAGLFAVEAQLP